MPTDGEGLILGLADGLGLIIGLEDGEGLGEEEGDGLIDGLGLGEGEGATKQATSLYWGKICVLIHSCSI